MELKIKPKELVEKIKDLFFPDPDEDFNNGCILMVLKSLDKILHVNSVNDCLSIQLVDYPSRDTIIAAFVIDGVIQVLDFIPKHERPIMMQERLCKFILKVAAEIRKKAEENGNS